MSAAVFLLAVTVAIFTGGNIYTLDPERPRAEAIAVDLESGKILAVGSEAAVRGAAAGLESRAVGLGGRTVVPGLIDAHAHLAGLGALARGELDLSGAKSFAEVVALAAERARELPEGAWVLGSRWDHESWAEKALPAHEALSAAVPDRPCWLTRVDGHAGIANRKALDLAGIGRDTVDPPGGEIGRGAGGEPTGVLVDGAMVFVERAVPESERPGFVPCLLAAQERCLAAGLTGVHDAGLSPDEVEALATLAKDGRLKLRVYAMLAGGGRLLRYLEENEPVAGPRLTCRSVKLYADGAMGSRGAWLLEPYADRPAGADGKPWVGLPTSSAEELRRVAEACLRRGYQVGTHAIGDRANREVLAAYEAAGVRPEHRFRIEHAQLVAVADIALFARLGIIASMQPTHATSDMRWAEARVGRARLAGAYAWARMVRAGVPLALGSDFPVESERPLLGIYAAVTRKDAAGKPDGGWLPEERLTREEALRGFTLGAAYAAFEETAKGSLEKGKLGDFVVLDRDVMTCAPSELLEATVEMTVIGGEVVFARAP